MDSCKLILVATPLMGPCLNILLLVLAGTGKCLKLAAVCTLAATFDGFDTSMDNSYLVNAQSTGTTSLY